MHATRTGDVREAYLAVYKKNEQVLIRTPDLTGLYHLYEVEMRQRAEDFYRKSAKKLEVAKRICASHKDPEKGYAVLQQAVADMEDAYHVKKAYETVCHLWATLRTRGLGLLQEKEMCKDLVKPPSADEGNPAEMQLAVPDAMIGDRPPRFGLHEPLPRDSVDAPPLGKEDEERTETEEIYLALWELCQRDSLCIPQLARFSEEMGHEKELLEKAIRGADRIRRILCFNRLVSAWVRSFAYEELQAHKRIGRFFHPPGIPCVPKNLR
eukprot:CAMPEP_0180711770 /NCGR_PEP_ID=MMETSP1038_2-20121128/11027_1 /TAXON_ID=632150 /ORGANISM="Azadinium spinosum, Strain 3D9" /LENGTH=266 /DNA_ID=CAMNT_0022744013 /DNA_START=51 /DNA_END=848 /DNA_ORIENTATION=-